MLARKYDSYAWEEQQYEEVQQPQRYKKINTDPYRQLRNRFMIFAVVILAASHFFGYWGILVSQPVSDFLTSIMAVGLLWLESQGQVS